MGSCSCSSKSKDQISSIKKVPSHSPNPNPNPKPSSSEEQKNPNKAKYTIEITPEEIRRRASKKKLTVTSTNEDNLEDLLSNAKNSSNLVLVRQVSLGKNEQGSLIILKKHVMYGGVLSDSSQNDFEEKLIEIEGDDKNNSLAQNHIWVSCKKGLKPDSPNQDDFVVMIEADYKLLGVFDGHGTHGHAISNFVHKAIPKNFLKAAKVNSNPAQALLDSFAKVQSDLITSCNLPEAEFDCTLSGSTATVLHLNEDKLTVAHVGDSRAVLARRTKGKLTAVDLTRDHKPNLPDELERVLNAGGEVRKMEEDVPHRVFFKGKHYPGIAMSRSVGDLLAQTIGVTCVPEVRCFDLTKEDEFIVVCSDGVWEFISSQEAVDEIEKYRKNPVKAAEGLATLAWNRWISNEGDVVDDITVVLAYLK